MHQLASKLCSLWCRVIIHIIHYLSTNLPAPNKPSIQFFSFHDLVHCAYESKIRGTNSLYCFERQWIWKFVMLLQLSRSISKSESCSVHLSLVVVRRYNVGHRGCLKMQKSNLRRNSTYGKLRKLLQKFEICQYILAVFGHLLNTHGGQMTCRVSWN